MRGGNVSTTTQDSLVELVLETRVEAELGSKRWRNLAECRDTSPDLFFPVGKTGLALEHIAQAKKVCARCAVQHDCLEYSLMTNQDAGIWGGATEDERRKMRRERRREARLKKQQQLR